MMTEIFLENRKLDISEDVQALLNYTIDDIKDFAARNTNFSKTITLPGTANNNLLFGHIFDARVSNNYDSTSDNVGVNFNAAKSAKCIIFQGNIQVMKGVLRLMEIVINSGVPEYEVSVYGELGGLVSSLGNKKLSDLDFSAYDHAWNVSGITATWDAAPGSGVFYPLIDYGNVSSNKVDYDIRALRPALFVREYVDKILTDANYSWESNLFNTTRFKKLIIPHNQKRLTSLSSQLLDGSRSSSQTVIDYSFSSSSYISFEISNTTVFTPNASPANTYTYNEADTVTMVIAWTLNYQWADTGNGMKIEVLKNSTVIATKNLWFTGGSLQSGVWTDSSTTSVANGDQISIRVSVTNSSTYYTFIATGASLNITSLTPIPVPISVNDTVVLNDAIPRNILQKDFLSSILKLFNLYVYEDKLKYKFLYIEPYVDFYDLNVSGILDWTDKMDRVLERRLKPMSEINSRYYNFKFKQDNDYYNETYRNRFLKGYGDYVYDSAYEFVNENEDIQLIFSGTPLVTYDGVDKTVSAIMKVTNGTEEQIDSNIRILQSKKKTGVTSWSIKDGGTVLQSGLTSYGYGGHYDDPDTPANDIQFGVPEEIYFVFTTGTLNVTQFNVYWSPYMAEITDKDSKLLSAYFRLTNLDIYNLDFSKFIYLDGSYWRLNKIIDWNAKNPDICVCELLKVIYTIY